MSELHQRSQLRVLRPRPGYYDGKPSPSCKRGYALVDRDGQIVGGPYATSAWANAGRRIINIDQTTIELVEVIHA